MSRCAGDALAEYALPLPDAGKGFLKMEYALTPVSTSLALALHLHGWRAGDDRGDASWQRVVVLMGWLSVAP